MRSPAEIPDGTTMLAPTRSPTVMATGSNSSDCANRRDNMKWQNYTSYGRLRDSAAAYYCYWYWDNL